MKRLAVRVLAFLSQRFSLTSQRKPGDAVGSSSSSARRTELAGSDRLYDRRDFRPSGRGAPDGRGSFSDDV